MSLPYQESLPSPVMQRPELENQTKIQTIQQKAAQALGKSTKQLPTPIVEHQKIQLKAMESTPPSTDQPNLQESNQSTINRITNWVRTEIFNKHGHAPAKEGLDANLKRQEVSKNLEVAKPAPESSSQKS